MKKFMNADHKAVIKELVAGEHKDAILAYGSDCANKGARIGLTAAAVCIAINKIAKYLVKRINVMDNNVASDIAKKMAK